MRRSPVLAALAAAGLTLGIGTGHALTRSPSHDARLVPAAEVADEPTTSTSTSTTVVEGDPGDPTTTSTTTPPTTEAPDPDSPPTTEAPHPSTTTTTEPHHSTPPTTRPQPTQLTLGCDSGDGDPSVACHWDGVPAGATKVVLLREVPGTGPAQPLWSTDDVDERDHVDDSATVGTTYVYRVSAYAGATFLETSNAERLKAGGGEPTPLAAGMSMSCASASDVDVRCEWGNGPAGTVRYRLARDVDGRHARVLTEGDVHSFVDRDAPAGHQLYWVQALDSTGKVIAVGRAEVDCCTAADS